MAVPSDVLDNARTLRTRQTDAENLLWLLLRNRRFCGFKFRRQHPVGRFILDFYCHEVLLAIELDGSSHTDSAQKAYDDERTRVLEGAGIRVIRFWNDDVLKNTESVLEALHAACYSPHPCPSP
ncbi:endonuclease domain-containing protein [Geobacter sp.]|uniref:endonuclease domain-containing protein n=1 Tax=Geobacter sp. TaxID=46610 RepID=UPI002610F004|nr:endonuclease domain-containing protein [Geobacter sp.]